MKAQYLVRILTSKLGIEQPKLKYFTYCLVQECPTIFALWDISWIWHSPKDTMTNQNQKIGECIFVETGSYK